MNLIDLTLEGDDALEQARNVMGGLDPDSIDAVRVDLTVEGIPEDEGDSAADADADKIPVGDGNGETDGGQELVTRSRTRGRDADESDRELDDVPRGTSYHVALWAIAQADEPVTSGDVADALDGIYSESTATSACTQLYLRKQLDRDESRPYTYWVSDFGETTVHSLGKPTDDDLPNGHTPDEIGIPTPSGENE